MADEKFIRSQIQRILHEAAPSPESPESDKIPKTGGVSAKGRVGRGRVKAEVSEAEALANSDPQKLMSKLKIDSASGSTTVEKILSVLKRAVRTLKSTKGLEDAYSSVSIQKTAEGVEYIRIMPDKLTERDAALYMKHTLIAAQNAGILTDLDKVIVPELAKTGQAVVKFLDAS